MYISLYPYQGYMRWHCPGLAIIEFKHPFSLLSLSVIFDVEICVSDAYSDYVYVSTVVLIKILWGVYRCKYPPLSRLGKTLWQLAQVTFSLCLPYRCRAVWLFAGLSMNKFLFLNGLKRLSFFNLGHRCTFMACMYMHIGMATKVNTCQKS